MILLIPAMLISSLSAQRITARYDVTFAIFGKIGEADLSFETTDNHYRIYAEGYLVDEAAALGSNRREIHESTGTIANGVLRPERYEVIRSSDHFYKIKRYGFDHAQKKVTEYRLEKRFITKSSFDLETFSMTTVPETLINERSKTLDYYADNDLQSLFFNVQSLMASMQEGETQIVHAVGGKNDKGEILIAKPSGAKQSELKRLMPDHHNRLITAVINQNIFKSKRGELYISLDDAYLVKEAMLKDVLLFGDIHGYRISLTKEP